MKQGDIIIVNFNPTQGHEQQGKRPAIVVSNDKFNQYMGGMCLLVPVTTKGTDFPTNIQIPNELPVEGKVVLNQLRSLDLNSRPYKKVGVAPTEWLNGIINILESFY